MSAAGLFWLAAAAAAGVVIGVVAGLLVVLLVIGGLRQLGGVITS